MRPTARGNAGNIMRQEFQPADARMILAISREFSDPGCDGPHCWTTHWSDQDAILLANVKVDAVRRHVDREELAGPDLESAHRLLRFAETYGPEPHPVESYEATRCRPLTTTHHQRESPSSTATERPSS